jgi:hypothetical protein
MVDGEVAGLDFVDEGFSTVMLGAIQPRQESNLRPGFCATIREK